MRVDIKSKNKFNVMLKKMFNNDHIPIVNGCSINSKNINKGDMFLSIKGKHLDGHDFIQEAIENGAILIFNERTINNNLDVVNIKVPNVINITKQMAKKWRFETNNQVIGITGSNGKTSTKEILNHIISKSKRTMYSKSNYNSTIGLPISMFEMSISDEFSILEMGANKSGEISEICKIASPNHGLITNISNAHNKYFGEISNIAKNKITLLKSLPKTGFAFINMDDPFLNKIELKSKIITYGFSGNYNFTGELVGNKVVINGEPINLPYSNMAIAQNYLAAYSVSKTLGISKNDIIEQLQKTPIYSGRGEIIIKNKVKFINDTYNSNLASCVNGIKATMQIKGNRKIFVLGDMLELGNEAINQHVKLGEIINSLNVAAVFGIGEHIKYTLDVINSTKILTKHFLKKREIIDMLKTYCKNDDVIYVKGSRSMKMEKIIFNKIF